jgi:hypothetical protein
MVMELATLWYAVVGFVAVIGAVAAGVIAAGERTSDGRRIRVGGIVLAFILAGCAIATITWEGMALRHFAREAGRSTRALIAGPVPNGGGDHEFAPRGRHYQHWIFEIPVAIGLAALAFSLLAGGGILYAAGYRRVLIGVTLWGVAAAAAVLLLTMVRFFHAFEIFI